MSFGVHVLGHCPPPVVDAMLNQVKRGTSFGTPYLHAIEFAKLPSFRLDFTSSALTDADIEKVCRHPRIW